MKANDEAVRESDQLEQLQDRFELWRREHPGRHRLPQELWCAAAELAQQYGLYRTAKRLRLGYDSLKRHMPKNAVVRGKRLRRPKFVELLPSSPMAMAECSVEVANVRGAKIKIELNGGAVRELLNLARLFWREL